MRLRLPRALVCAAASVLLLAVIALACVAAERHSSPAAQRVDAPAGTAAVAGRARPHGDGVTPGPPTASEIEDEISASPVLTR